MWKRLERCNWHRCRRVPVRSLTRDPKFPVFSWRLVRQAKGIRSKLYHLARSRPLGHTDLGDNMIPGDEHSGFADCSRRCKSF